MFPIRLLCSYWLLSAASERFAVLPLHLGGTSVIPAFQSISSAEIRLEGFLVVVFDCCLVKAD
jgi:hypothetical protein